MVTTSRYSQHARRAMNRARLIAKEDAHPCVDSTHLLMGILHEQGSIGCNILHDLQVDLRRAERAFRQLPRPESCSSNANESTSPLKDALLLATDESRRLGQHYVGTEHLLLGLMRSSEGVLLALLHSLDINSEQIRRRVLRLLQEGITEISLEQARRVSRLSELTRRVLNGAEQIAVQMGHRYVGLAHLLLVLCHEQRSVCARILQSNGLDETLLEANLTKAHPATGGHLGDIIDRAIDHAERCGSHYIGTDHLLLTLALDRRGVRLLRKYGVNPRSVAEQMRLHIAR